MGRCIMGRTRRRQLLKRIGIASSVGVAGLAGCAGGDGSNGDGSSPDGDGTDADGDATTPGDGGGSYTVGVFAPLSGPFAPWGSALVTGATLAAADLESELGVDLTVNEYDTETNPDTGLQRMQRAVTRDGIDFAQGGVSSAVCTSMGSWASDNGVSYIAQGASDTLTGANCASYMFSVYQSNTMMSTATGSHMADEADSWYLLYADYVWGQNAQGIVEQVLQDNGASVVGTDATPFPGDDYSQYVNNVANSDASGVALLVPGLDARLASQQLIAEGLHEELAVMVHQLEDLVYWGLNEEAAAMVDVGPTGWINAVDGGEDFKQRVADQGDNDPFARQYMSYTSMDQHVRAAERAGSADAEAIRGALEGHEVTGPVADIQPGTLYWRACDHQLVQPTHVVSGRAVADMTEDPYRQWFTVDATVPGDDVVRSCEETGCSR